MGDTFVRVLAMLREVPVAPRAIDTVTLQARLADLGFAADLRTIQRDLVRFSTVLALRCDDSARPYRWSYQSNRAVDGVPTVSPARALALELLEHHLNDLLPPSIRERLQGDFSAARALLGFDEESTAQPGTRPPLTTWLDKVAVVPRGPWVQPPEVAPRVLDAVADALFRDRQLSMRYQGKSAGRAHTWEVSPLGLVVRGPVLVLVACFSDTLAPRQFLLHRAKAATVLEKAVDRPDAFSLSDYAAAGEFGVRLSDTTVTFRARFEASAAPSVVETPLSPEQRLTFEPGGAVVVEADVIDTSEFRGWLLGMGDLVEVFEPAALREHLAGVLSRAANRYAAGAPVTGAT